MTKRVNKFLITSSLLMLFSLASIAQPPLPAHGQNNDQQPAPIGSGLLILLSLAGAYGAKKVYDARKKLND